MEKINIEIKAQSCNQDFVRQILIQHDADFIGVDHQIDTYFFVPNGRLKLREGNIENKLIHYVRNNQDGPKKSDITLSEFMPESSLKNVLTKSLGIKVVVDKKREIYFIDNVKFHIDVVKDLGTFVEIEAIDKDNSIGVKKLRAQCDHYIDLLYIKEEDLISMSYSDLLLSQ